jgi:hypothetical protein
MQKAGQFRDKIEAMIMQAEDVFDTGTSHQDLRVTIRIACEFYDFLQMFGDQTEISECEYMAATIRGGMDQFYSLSYAGNCVRGLELRKGFGLKPPVTQLELKSSYISGFDELLRCESPVAGIGLLVHLSRTMLFFMASYFPYPAD